FDRPAVQLDDLAADVQAQTEPAEVALTMGLVEAVEQIRAPFRGNTQSPVTNDQFDPGRVRLAEHDLDFAPVGAVPHRIADQVGDDLFEPHRINGGEAWFGCDQGQRVLRGACLYGADDATHQFDQVRRLLTALELA